MTKLPLSNIANLQNESTVVTTIATNNAATTAAMEKTLSRDGTSPNQMNSDFDMNSHRVLNLVDAIDNREPATFGQLRTSITAVGQGSVVNGTYLTLSNNPNLLSNRVLTAGTNIGFTDTGATGTLIVGVNDPELNALSNTVSAADTVPYYTGSGTASVTSLPAYGRSLISAVDAATARTTLGSVIGTNVQAWDTDLDAVAGLTTTGLISRTGTGTAVTRTVTGTANEITIVNGDGLSGNPTASLPTSLTFTGKTVTGGSFSSPSITTPTGIVKADVGLGNVDNTSDATKNSAAVTLTNKTIDTAGSNNLKVNGNTFAATAGTATITVPNTSDTLVGRATTDTLTNKTISGASNTLSNIANASLTNSAITVGTTSVSLGGTLSAVTGRGTSGLNVERGTSVGDVNYTVLSTDRFIYTGAAFTAARTWTLPAANAVNPGQRFLIGDLQGTLTGTNALIVSRAGTDTINGGTIVTLNTANASAELVSDGTSKWYAVQASSTGGGSGGSSFAQYEYTATASQTSFSGADINGNSLVYTPGFILVFVNGDKVNKADYTATTGTTVVFGAGRALNDQVTIIAMNQSSVALLPTNNLSDVLSATTARTNLGMSSEVGKIEWWCSTRVPSGRLKANGQSVSRTTYANLFAYLVYTGAATFTNASTSVGMTAHGLSVGDPIKLFTTGTLPTNFTASTHGLPTVGTNYFVKTVVDANTVTLASTVGGTAISAGSAGSGTHTWVNAAFGDGDGSTTFTVPDLRGNFVRSWNDDAAVDSNRTLGDTQFDAFQGHFHGTSQSYATFAAGSAAASFVNAAGVTLNQANIGSAITDGSNGTPRTAAETRPRNISMMATIRYAA